MPSVTRAAQAAWGALFLVFGVALIRDTAHNGHDTGVFWQAGNAILVGDPVYWLGRDGAMAYKYPPWITPFFLPFAGVSLATGKWLWGVVEVLSLAAVFRWLQSRARANLHIIGVTGLAFWGIWVIHALDGQIALPMLALALWTFEAESASKSLVAGTLLVLALSTKIFTLLPLWEFRRDSRARKVAAASLAAAALLSLPVLRVTRDHSVPQLFRDWREAATSGLAQFGSGHVYGAHHNPGLTAVLFRAFPDLLSVPGAEIGIPAILALIFAILWSRRARTLAPRERWAGWLALTPVIHPLPWWHLFAFAYPAAVLALDRKRNPWLAGIGLALLALGSESALGLLGIVLETVAAKSLGTLLCLAALAQAGSTRTRSPSTPSGRT